MDEQQTEEQRIQALADKMLKERDNLKTINVFKSAAITGATFGVGVGTFIIIVGAATAFSRVVLGNKDSSS